MLPALRAGNGGSIVNISSLADIVGLPFSGLYCALGRDLRAQVAWLHEHDVNAKRARL
ncbi:MAG TPA: hypothetical protein VII07_12295 [Bradyrhizobium sp.]